MRFRGTCSTEVCRSSPILSLYRTHLASSLLRTLILCVNASFSRCGIPFCRKLWFLGRTLEWLDQSVNHFCIGFEQCNTLALIKSHSIDYEEICYACLHISFHFLPPFHCFLAKSWYEMYWSAKSTPPMCVLCFRTPVMASKCLRGWLWNMEANSLCRIGVFTSDFLVRHAPWKPVMTHCCLNIEIFADAFLYLNIEIIRATWFLATKQLSYEYEIACMWNWSMVALT